MYIVKNNLRNVKTILEINNNEKELLKTKLFDENDYSRWFHLFDREQNKILRSFIFFFHLGWAAWATRGNIFLFLISRRHKT